MASYVYDCNVFDSNNNLLGTNGNIQHVKTYAYTTGTLGTVISDVEYKYLSNSPDMLYKYNGSYVNYDYLGSVTSFAGKGIVYEAGRQVKSITTGDNVYGYTCDENGLCRNKKVNGVVSNYFIWMQLYPEFNSYVEGKNNGSVKIYV